MHKTPLAPPSRSGIAGPGLFRAGHAVKISQGVEKALPRQTGALDCVLFIRLGGRLLLHRQAAPSKPTRIEDVLDTFVVDVDGQVDCLQL